VQPAVATVQQAAATGNVRDLARAANAQAAQLARGGNLAGQQRGVGAVLAVAPGGAPRGQRR